MNIAIDEHFDQFIRAQVSSGRFQSADEVVLEGLRLIELRETRIQTLRAHVQAALAEGGRFTDEELAAFLAADDEGTDIYIDRQAKLQVLRAHLEATHGKEGGYSDEELDELLRGGELAKFVM